MKINKNLGNEKKTMTTVFTIAVLVLCLNKYKIFIFL